MTGFWSDSTKAAAGAEASTGSMVETLAAGAASGALISEAMEKSEASAARGASSMGKIADHAKNAASSILHATESLAKWAVLSLGAGLIGGGVGLFGLDRLAESVSGQRKSALGLGITSAEQTAFDTNFGTRLVGSNFLQGIQDVKSDLAQQWQFTQLGIQNPGERDTAELGIDVIHKARDLWSQAGAGGHNQQWMQAHGLSGFMDYNTWQRIGQASPAELAGYENQYRKDVKTVGATDPVQKDWQDFMIQLKRAGAQIEAVFVTALDPLIKSGALPKLSDSIVHLVQKFFANPEVTKWVDQFAKYISEFGDYLGSEKFSHDMKSLVDDIAYAAHKMADVLRFLGFLPTSPDTPTSDLPHDASGGYNLPTVKRPVENWRQLLGIDSKPYDFTDVEKAYELPAGVLKAVGWEESHLNPDVKDSPAGAKGIFQFMPDTAKRYNITDTHSVNQEANAAGMYLRDLMREFHGDIAKALAGYNWGEGNVEKDVAAHGDQWRNFLPNETKKYLNDILPKIDAARVNVHVSVTNQTGANVAVVANAVRQ